MKNNPSGRLPLLLILLVLTLRLEASGAEPAPRPTAIPNLATLSLPAGCDAKTALRFAFAHEAHSFWRVEQTDPIARVLGQMEAMIARFAVRGVDVTAERKQIVALRARDRALSEKHTAEALQSLLFDARLAKRRLMFRDPSLVAMQKVIFVKRHPYLPSHNYTDIYDSRFAGGGGIFTLTMPHIDGRLEPARAELRILFDAGGGIARDVALDWDARTVYFAYRLPGGRGAAFWNLRRMDVDGGNCRQITEGPFHDTYPCVLPDGDLVFVSTRCKGRYLCLQSVEIVTLFRSRPDGSDRHPLSYANFSEWGSSVMRDGRILWTRSEYQDKGAAHGHTLWAAHPDGTHVELVFGNNSGLNLMNGYEMPGGHEVCATLIPHFGDFQGPIAIIDRAKGPFGPNAARIITPDEPVRNAGNGGRFRDPVPVSEDCILVSHMLGPHWSLYLIDRHGNRELLYWDPKIGSMCPLPLGPRRRPPVLPSYESDGPPNAPGRLVVADVYRGLGDAVPRGSVKYIRICRELRSDLDRLPDKGYGAGHQKYRAGVVEEAAGVRGPYGWPSFIAKAVIGTVPVEADGSANFEAPSGAVLYFQALDADYNEIQRMRSVMQLQPGEIRSCVGCHENRHTSALSAPTDLLALRREPSKPQTPPWNAGPFDYRKFIQPILDAKCVRCHDAKHPKGLDLSGTLDQVKVPSSYRKLISGGWVHHFDLSWGAPHTKAEPLSFGTLKSKLFSALEGKQHQEVKLTNDELLAVKCWIDLNLPLWPDYMNRDHREGAP